MWPPLGPHVGGGPRGFWWWVSPSQPWSQALCHYLALESSRLGLRWEEAGLGGMCFMGPRIHC